MLRELTHAAPLKSRTKYNLCKLRHAALLNLCKGKNENAAGCEWFVLDEEQNSNFFKEAQKVTYQDLYF